MAIELYMHPVSPPVRAVQMTAKALGINLELKHIDLWKGEQITPEYLKMNPQHTIPVINDNGVIIWDSHAINAYLVTKYAKNDSLYPKDPVKRAIVDQRLHFDTGILFARAIQTFKPILFHNKKTLEQDRIDAFMEAFEFLENFLENRKLIAGDSITIADYSIYTTLSSINVLVPINSNKFPKLNAWYQKVDALPESEVTKEGVKMTVELINKAFGK